MTEQQIQAKIITYLQFKGAWVVKTIETNKRGTPDILACIGGTFVGIEVKRPGKSPSVQQSLQIENIEKAGGVAFVASSVQEAQTKLEEYFE